MTRVPSLIKTARCAAERLEYQGSTAAARALIHALQELGDDVTPSERSQLLSLAATIDLRQGRFEDGAMHARQAVECAETSDDLHAQSKALYAQGEVAYLSSAWRGQGTLDDALEVHQRCLAVRERLDDPRAVAESLSRIGVIHERREEQQQAIACFDRAMEILRVAGIVEGDSRALVHLGAAEDRAGNLEGALDYYERSIDASRVDHDARALTFDLCNVASALARLGVDLPRAERLLDEASALASSMDWKLAQIRVAQVSGDVQRAHGNRAQALECYRDAMETAREYSFERFISHIEDRIEQLEEAA